MGSYMSAEAPGVDWGVLHREVQRLGEEYDLSFACEGGPEDVAAKEDFERCQNKDTEHQKMKALLDFELEHLPEEWRFPEVYYFIRHHARFVVKIRVLYTSVDRPDNKHYSRWKDRGYWIPVCGTGYALITPKHLEKPLIDCPIKDCFLKKKDPHHKVTSEFIVDTATHVVFDDSEAETATIEFFYESENDDDTDGRVLRGEVLRTNTSGPPGDCCGLICVSHDTKLFEKVLDGEFAQRPQLPSPLPSSSTTKSSDPNPRSPLVVIIAHPHGHVKQVSTGSWLSYKPVFDEYKEFAKKKIFDFLVEIYATCPNWRETGYTSEYNEYWAPSVVEFFEQIVQANPEMTFGEGAANNGTTDVPIPYMKYSTSTCPGSSGARVWTLTETTDGASWDVAMEAAHFRKHKVGENQSGEVTVLRSCTREVEKLLDILPQDVKRKKKKTDKK